MWRATIDVGSPHRKEFEAEEWAIRAFRRHGVSVTRIERDHARSYVSWKIEQAVRRGARQLDRDAVKWCRGFHRSRTLAALVA